MQYLYKFCIVSACFFTIDIACADQEISVENRVVLDQLKQEDEVVKKIKNWIECVVNIVDITQKEDIQQNMQNSQKVMSLGSGFVINDDGIIVTNNHVICDAGIENIRVISHDGVELKPTLLGYDSRYDIAVLKVPPFKHSKYLKLGDSSHIDVGRRVFAIGHPYGFGFSVTSGIVSFCSRNLANTITKLGNGLFINYLQTDAAINNGNSGGPLILEKTGEVVGMNTSIFSNSESNSGINFALPSNIIKSVVSQIIKFGKIRKPWFGISFESVPQEALNALQIPDYKNAVAITKIEENSPSSKSDLQVGDIIVEINGIKLEKDIKIFDIVDSFILEKKVNVKYRKNKQQNKFPIKLRSIDLDVCYKDIAEEKVNISEDKRNNGIFIDELGIYISSTNTNKNSEYQLSKKREGITVSAVETSAGNSLQIGDVLLSVTHENVGSKSLTSVEELSEFLDNIKPTMKRGEHTQLAFFIERNNVTYYKSVKFTNKSDDKKIYK